MRDVPRPSRTILGATAAIAVWLGAIRWWLLPRFDAADGLWDRLGTEALWIAAYAPARTAFGMFANSQLLVGTTSFVLLLQVCGARHAWRNPESRTGWAWICGLVLLVACCLPLAVIMDLRSTRLNLAVLSASIMLGAGAGALMEWTPVFFRWWRLAAVATLMVGIASQGAVQRQTRIDRFEPCSDGQLMLNDFAQAWPEITPDLRAWLHDMPGVCAAGLFASPEDRLASMRWSNAERHVVLVNRGAHRVALAFAPPSADTTLRVRVDGVPHELRLLRGASTLQLPLAPSWRTWLRRGYRLDVRDATGAPVPALVAVRVE